MSKTGNGKRQKTAVGEKTQSVVKRPQSHGGALLPGGVNGNRGGTGRPDLAQRTRYASMAQKAAELLWDRLHKDPDGFDNRELIDIPPKYDPELRVKQEQRDILKRVEFVVRREA